MIADRSIGHAVDDEEDVVEKVGEAIDVALFAEVEVFVGGFVVVVVALNATVVDG